MTPKALYSFLGQLLGNGLIVPISSSWKMKAAESNTDFQFAGVL